MKKQFRLTYDTVTEESASYGDHATHGFVTADLIIPDGNHFPETPAHFTLKEALGFCEEHDGHREADSCPISLQCPPRWFNFCNGERNEDTLSVTVSLHLPRNITPSSAMRIARIIQPYGLHRLSTHVISHTTEPANMASL